MKRLLRKLRAVMGIGLGAIFAAASVAIARKAERHDVEQQEQLALGARQDW